MIDSLVFLFLASAALKTVIGVFFLGASYHMDRAARGIEANDARAGAVFLSQSFVVVGWQFLAWPASGPWMRAKWRRLRNPH